MADKIYRVYFGGGFGHKETSSLTLAKAWAYPDRTIEVMTGEWETWEGDDD